MRKGDGFTTGSGHDLNLFFLWYDGKKNSNSKELRCVN